MTTCRCGEPAVVNGRCAYHERKREYHRQYAARKRRAALDAKRATERRCPRRLGGGVCGMLLEITTDGHGRPVSRCRACERMAAGICADCPRPVEGMIGRAKRCAEHKRTAALAAIHQSAIRNRDEINARARRSYQKDKAERRRRNEYKKLWRKANPDKVRAQKRRAGQRSSERDRAYQIAYREQRRLEIAARQQQRYHGQLPPRLCVTPGCERVVWSRRKKCRPCVALEQQQARSILGERRAA